MKLDLNHIAPYLPYKLGIEISNYKCDYVGIKRSVITGCYHIGSEPYFTYERGFTGKSFEDFKPILRPLSDLTKEIEVHGVKLIPIEYFFETWCRNPKPSHQEYYHTETPVSIGCSHYSTAETFEFKKNVFNNYAWVVQKLYEWKFDVQALIESGLAIDINTLTENSKK